MSTCEYSTDRPNSRRCTAYFEGDKHCITNPEQCPLRESRKKLEDMGRHDLIVDLPLINSTGQVLEGGY